MEFALTVFGLTILVVIIIVAIKGISAGKTIKKEEQKAEQMKAQITVKNEKISKKALETLKQQEFVPSHTCYLSDYASATTQEKNKKQMLCVDAEKRKLSLIDYTTGEVIIINFTDLISYEVYENGKTDTFNYGEGISESQAWCQELKLILRLKSYSKPQAEYILISDAAYKEYKALNGHILKSTEIYKQIRNDLQQTVSYIEMILNENKNG